MKNRLNRTPKEIVEHLDKYIIGQDNAKKSVAIALRNRWRRKNAPEDMRNEILPNNILMIGPTGVGKTEIARRLAAMAGAPFVKVEASKFTEIGYVGRDVESMVRDLVELAVNMVKHEQAVNVAPKAQENTNDRLLDLLLPPLSPPPPKPRPRPTSEFKPGIDFEIPPKVEPKVDNSKTREKFRKKLLNGDLDDKQVELNTATDKFPTVEIFSPMGMEEMGINFQEMFSGLMPKKTKRRKLTIAEARKILYQEEIAKLVNMDDCVEEGLTRAQEMGIIFIDEIDKIAGVKSKAGPDVSREGVQRDILPIVEGSAIMTKYGMVHTDHILYIAAGAFHMSKPSDLIPELQGRFPIRVELDSLTAKEFVRILSEPRSALTKQYTALMLSEKIKLSFEKKALVKIAQIAETINKKTENIGARRLQTVMTTLLEEIMFDAPNGKKTIKITNAMVEKRLKEYLEDEDLSRYIL